MRSEAKSEIGCWAIFWIVPIVMTIVLITLKELNGGDAFCSGVYSGKCSILEIIIHEFNFFVGMFAFFWIYFGWIYFIFLFGRIGYLLVKRFRKG